LGDVNLVPIVAAMFDGQRKSNPRGAAPTMNGGGNIDRRIERVAFETDRHIIVGDVTLPPEGYQSRFSDTMNREDLPFVPLLNVEITERDTGKVSERPFIVLSKSHVWIAHPA
jgi:Family of unknown function (DUF6812)